MNWLIVGGVGLIVVYLAGRRVAKRDESQEPTFATWEGPSSGVPVGEGFYGGLGGGDGFLVSDAVISPKESDLSSSGSEEKPLLQTTLMEKFVGDIGRTSARVVDVDLDLSGSKDEPLNSATPRSARVGAASSDSTPISARMLEAPASSTPKAARVLAPAAPGASSVSSLVAAAPVVAIPKASTIAAAISPSTQFGSSSLSMSAIPSTTGNDRAVSAAVQVQPPKTFSTQSAAISEQNMLPAIVAKPVQIAPKAVVAPTKTIVAAKPMSVKESFVAAIAPTPIKAATIVPTPNKPAAIAPTPIKTAPKPVAIAPTPIKPAAKPAAKPSMLKGFTVKR